VTGRGGVAGAATNWTIIPRLSAPKWTSLRSPCTTFLAIAASTV